MDNTEANVERVDDVEAFALKHGISVEEAQDLIDRVGTDLEALEDAVLVRQAEATQP